MVEFGRQIWIITVISIADYFNQSFSINFDVYFTFLLHINNSTTSSALVNFLHRLINHIIRELKQEQLGSKFDLVSLLSGYFVFIKSSLVSAYKRPLVNAIKITIIVHWRRPLLSISEKSF